MNKLANCIFVILLCWGCSHNDMLQFVNEDIKANGTKTFVISSFEVSANSIHSTFSTANFIYMYVVAVQNGKYNSVLTINSKTGSAPITIKYTLDTPAKQWELYQEEKVLSASYGLNTNPEILPSSYPDHISAIDSFMNRVSVQPETKAKLSLLAYHSSILSVSNRQFSENKGCTVYPFFLLGRSLFRCQEDVFYSQETLEKALTLTETDLSEDAQDLRIALKRYGKKRIPFKILYHSTDKKVNLKKIIQNEKSRLVFSETSALFDEFLNNFTFSINYDYDNLSVTHTSGCKCSGPCGSSLGCCGNYSGCCVVWSKLCLIHDLECLKCAKWHCGWACKPEASKDELTPEQEPVVPNGYSENL